MNDTIHFGYPTLTADDVQSKLHEFVDELIKVFPNATWSMSTDTTSELIDIQTNSDDDDKYLAWLLANAWHKRSMQFNIAIATENRHKIMEKLLFIAKFLFINNVTNRLKERN